MVRYRLAPDQVGSSGETLTDVVGVLEEWGVSGGSGGGTATVRRASGERVTVHLALIVAGKVLPPASKRPRRQQ